MKTKFLSAAVLTALLLASPAQAWSPKLSVDDDTWIQLGLLGQFRYESGQDPPGAGERWSHEFYTRRFRIMGLGSVHPKVRFFFSTDVPTTGRAGAANTIIWNDGFVDFQIRPELKIQFGRILVPFSLENKASATSLLGIDYNQSLLKIPSPVDRSYWRDDGIEIRGLLFGERIDYRVGIFRGDRDTTTNAGFLPRSTGMVMINLQDSMGGWFFNPNSMGAHKLISLGGGYDFIAHSDEDTDNAIAWNAFAIVEQGVFGGRLNAMLGYYNWDGPGWGGFEGATMGAQLGYLLPGETLAGRWQPVVRFQRQDDSRVGGLNLNTVNLGLNYYLKGQAANLKLDYAMNDRRDDAGQRRDTLRFQAQFLF